MKNEKVKEKGRILKVKKGYNPNSSSIGSDILPFLAFAAASGIVTVLVMNTLSAIGRTVKKNKAKLEPLVETDENGS